jgi:Spy/CpxP family protein refolding chaperone
MRSSKENRMIKDGRTLWVSRLIVAGLLSSGLVFGTTAAWADGDGHGYGHDPKSRLERMTKKLDLTKEQQDNILPILEDKHEKMEALHKQMKEMRQNAMAQIEAQLTPDQQEKFRKAREERKEKMKEYREKHGKGHKKGKYDKDKDHD